MCMSRMFAFMSAVMTVQGFVVYRELLKVVGFISHCEVLCVVDVMAVVGLPGGPRPAKRLSGQPEPYYGWPGWPAIIFHKC